MSRRGCQSQSFHNESMTPCIHSDYYYDIQNNRWYYVPRHLTSMPGAFSTHSHDIFRPQFRGTVPRSGTRSMTRGGRMPNPRTPVSSKAPVAPRFTKNRTGSLTALGDDTKNKSNRDSETGTNNSQRRPSETSPGTPDEKASEQCTPTEDSQSQITEHNKTTSTQNGSSIGKLSEDDSLHACLELKTTLAIDSELRPHHATLAVNMSLDSNSNQVDKQLSENTGGKRHLAKHHHFQSVNECGDPAFNCPFDIADDAWVSEMYEKESGSNKSVKLNEATGKLQKAMDEHFEKETTSSTKVRKVTEHSESAKRVICPAECINANTVESEQCKVVGSELFMAVSQPKENKDVGDATDQHKGTLAPFKKQLQGCNKIKVNENHVDPNSLESGQENLLLESNSVSIVEARYENDKHDVKSSSCTKASENVGKNHSTMVSKRRSKGGAVDKLSSEDFKRLNWTSDVTDFKDKRLILGTAEMASMSDESKNSITYEQLQNNDHNTTKNSHESRRKTESVYDLSLSSDTCNICEHVKRKDQSSAPEFGDWKSFAKARQEIQPAGVGRGNMYTKLNGVLREQWDGEGRDDSASKREESSSNYSCGTSGTGNMRKVKTHQEDSNDSKINGLKTNAPGSKDQLRMLEQTTLEKDKRGSKSRTLVENAPALVAVLNNELEAFDKSEKTDLLSEESSEDKVKSIPKVLATDKDIDAKSSCQPSGDKCVVKKAYGSRLRLTRRLRICAKENTERVGINLLLDETSKTTLSNKHGAVTKRCNVVSEQLSHKTSEVDDDPVKINLKQEFCKIPEPSVQLSSQKHESLDVQDDALCRSIMETVLNKVSEYLTSGEICSRTLLYPADTTFPESQNGDDNTNDDADPYCAHQTTENNGEALSEYLHVSPLTSPYKGTTEVNADEDLYRADVHSDFMSNATTSSIARLKVFNDLSSQGSNTNSSALECIQNSAEHPANSNQSQLIASLLTFDIDAADKSPLHQADEASTTTTCSPFRDSHWTTPAGNTNSPFKAAEAEAECLAKGGLNTTDPTCYSSSSVSPLYTLGWRSIAQNQTLQNSCTTGLPTATSVSTGDCVIPRKIPSQNEATDVRSPTLLSNPNMRGQVSNQWCLQADDIGLYQGPLKSSTPNTTSMLCRPTDRDNSAHNTHTTTEQSTEPLLMSSSSQTNLKCFSVRGGTVACSSTVTSNLQGLDAGNEKADEPGFSRTEDCHRSSSIAETTGQPEALQKAPSLPPTCRASTQTNRPSMVTVVGRESPEHPDCVRLLVVDDDEKQADFPHSCHVETKLKLADSPGERPNYSNWNSPGLQEKFTASRRAVQASATNDLPYFRATSKEQNANINDVTSKSLPEKYIGIAPKTKQVTSKEPTATGSFKNVVVLSTKFHALNSVSGKILNYAHDVNNAMNTTRVSSKTPSRTVPCSKRVASSPGIGSKTCSTANLKTNSGNPTEPKTAQIARKCFKKPVHSKSNNFHKTSVTQAVDDLGVIANVAQKSTKVKQFGKLSQKSIDARTARKLTIDSKWKFEEKLTKAESSDNKSKDSCHKECVDRKSPTDKFTKTAHHAGISDDVHETPTENLSNVLTAGTSIDQENSRHEKEKVVERKDHSCCGTQTMQPQEPQDQNTDVSRLGASTEEKQLLNTLTKTKEIPRNPTNLNVLAEAKFIVTEATKETSLCLSTVDKVQNESAVTKSEHDVCETKSKDENTGDTKTLDIKFGKKTKFASRLPKRVTPSSSWTKMDDTRTLVTSNVVSGSAARLSSRVTNEKKGTLKSNTSNRTYYVEPTGIPKLIANFEKREVISSNAAKKERITLTQAKMVEKTVNGRLAKTTPTDFKSEDVALQTTLLPRSLEAGDKSDEFTDLTESNVLKTRETGNSENGDLSRLTKSSTTPSQVSVKETCSKSSFIKIVPLPSNKNTSTLSANTTLSNGETNISFSTTCATGAKVRTDTESGNSKKTECAAARAAASEKKIGSRLSNVSSNIVNCLTRVARPFTQLVTGKVSADKSCDNDSARCAGNCLKTTGRCDEDSKAGESYKRLNDLDITPTTKASYNEDKLKNSETIACTPDESACTAGGGGQLSKRYSYLRRTYIRHKLRSASEEQSKAGRK